MDLVAYGSHAWLVRFATLPDEAAFELSRVLARRFEEQPLAGLWEFVPALTTMLLVFETREFRDAVQPGLEVLLATALGSDRTSEQQDRFSPSRLIEVPARYHGPDLAQVAQRPRLSVDEVIARHLAVTYRVHCLGFAPGFPYLGGLDPQLHTPRLANPRPRVPAGSIAIGGEHTGIYSIASPGGWNLIGSTDLRLFRPQAETLDAMFRLRAGDRVRFVLDHSSPDESPSEGAPLKTFDAGVPALRVLSSGFGLSVQDLGRPGFARFGVPPSGAMDPHAAACANRLLDNAPELPVLELCLQGQQFEVLRDGWLAVTGSAGGASTRIPPWSTFRVHVGERLDFPATSTGVWSYLAVPGGWAAAVILGSASANPRAGLGSALRAGDLIGAATGREFELPSWNAARRVSWTEIPNFSQPAPFRVWPGPQGNRFPDSARETFSATEWTISSQCDRVGYRLDGAVLAFEIEEIISEPVLPGTVQVPPNGRPIITMPDGPTVGGYPKLGWVDSRDLPRLAQCRPGQRVTFAWI